MRYTIFGEKTGLRVSQYALGTGNFGTGWGYGAEPAAAREMFDSYVAAGGNFIDTADQYQFGQSEELVGEFIAPNRDDFVLATKFSLGAAAQSGLLATGNSRKTMVAAVEQSLRRLKTDRIDLLWVHMPDEATPMEEIARGFDNLVRQGKVLYVGLSDFPAWRVARAATIAELRGWAPIAGLQIEYSLVERTPDRELLPMARGLGLGTVGWSPMGGGFLTGKYRRGEEGRADTLKALVHAEDSDHNAGILDALEAVAKELDANMGQVAIAWSSAKGIIPILGPKTKAQLDDTLGAVGLKLTDAHIAQLDQASAVKLGFPHDMVGSERMRQRLSGSLLTEIDYPAVLRE